MADKGCDAFDVQRGETAHTRSGRDEGAASPRPTLLQEPLEHNCVRAAVEEGRPAGRGVIGQSVVCARLQSCRRLAGKPSFAAPSSSRAAPGFRWPGFAGLLEAYRLAGRLVGWVVGAHAVSGSDLTQLANEMRDVATHYSTPDQRRAHHPQA